MTRFLRTVATAAALALLVPAASDAAGPVFDDSAHAEAQRLETSIADNLWFGQVLEVDYATPARKPGDIVSVHHFGDSALWTGVYLAGQSYRYEVAKAKIAAGEDVSFWTTQRDEALARVRMMVEKFHILATISKAWQTELDPQLEPEVSFGGGVFPGEPGLLFRACIPADAQPWQTWGDIGTNKRVTGPLTWDNDTADPTDDRDYYCEGGTSRDAYAGTTFGLMTAFDLVGSDEPALAARIRDDIVAMSTFALKYGWTTPRPHGRVSLPANQLEPITKPYDAWGHDFENFISPLFAYVPAARLNMVQSAREVTRVAGTPEEAVFWEGVWAEELATQGPILAASLEIDSMEPNGGYYPFNLHHLTSMNTIRFERDVATREMLRQAMSIMDHTTRNDMNAHFEAITFAVTGEQERAADAIEHLDGWIDYRARVSTGAPVRNSTRCGVDLTCVPRDQWDWVFPGADGETVVTVKPGTDGRRRAAIALRPEERPPTDFLWQRPPTNLDGGEPATYQAPGIDFLTPYWMLRYFLEVVPPVLAPFPAWVGPEHR